MAKKKLDVQIPAAPAKKKWKDLCDGCGEYKEDCKGFFTELGKTRILCPECWAKENPTESLITEIVSKKAEERK